MINLFKSTHKNNARTFLSGFLLVSFTLVFTSCQNSAEEIESLTGISKANEVDKAKEVTMYYSDKGKVKAVIRAKEFMRNAAAQKPYADIKQSLKVEFYNDSLEVESTLTAKSARIYESDGNVIVRDNVVVVNKKGERLETEELVWNQKLDKFYTNKKVTIINSPTQIMRGDGLEANADFSWYKIGNLKGNIAVDGKDVPN